MNKYLFIILINFVLIFKIFSIEEVLIDFNNLKDTEVDFLKDVPNAWGEYDAKDNMKASLDIKYWQTILRKSSQIPEAINKTYAIEVKNSLRYPGISLLGVRVLFPDRPSNADVVILPPFEIPSYYDDPANPDGLGTYFINKGIVRNVGIIRKISVNVLGNNFNYGLYIKIKNNRGEEKDIYMGQLTFLGWRTLTWVNPNYEHEKKMRDKARKVLPYYPEEYPYVKFMGFIVQRNYGERNGNFTAMFKDVFIEYDEHFLKIDNYEYLQEDIYHIHKEELIKRAKKEMERVNRRIYMQWLESQRMDNPQSRNQSSDIKNEHK